MKSDTITSLIRHQGGAGFDSATWKGTGASNIPIFLGEDTIATDTILIIERISTALKCGQYTQSIHVRKERLGDAICPKRDTTGIFIVSSREYSIKKMATE